MMHEVDWGGGPENPPAPSTVRFRVYPPQGIDFGGPGELRDVTGAVHEVPRIVRRDAHDADLDCTYDEEVLDLSGLPEGWYTLIVRGSDVPSGVRVRRAEGYWSPFEGEEALLTELGVGIYPGRDAGPSELDAGP